MSTHTQPQDKSSIPASKTLYAAVTLASIGLALSVFLALSALTGDSIAGCTEAVFLNCNHVLQSKFAKIAGVPVSIPGAMTMATILACLCVGSVNRPGWHRVQQTALPLAVTAATASACWFIWLQFFQLGKVCIFCLGIHICSLALAVLILHSPVNVRQSMTRHFPAIASIALMAVIQWQSVDPPSFEFIPPQAESGAVQVVQVQVDIGSLEF